MNKNYNDFLNTCEGKNLLKKHSLDEVGIWQIMGEDSNCDIGGSHTRPVLGYFNGKLKDIIEYGISLPRFWTWGGGGGFLKVEIQDINSPEFKHKLNLRNEKAKLMSRIEEIDSALKGE